jgi:capsular polysaccharide biosynthesis protein
VKPPGAVPRPRDYLRILAGAWVLILIATLSSAGAAWAVRQLREPVYTATVRVFATVSGASGTRSAFEGSRGALSYMETYDRLASSALVISRVADQARVSTAVVTGALTAEITPGSSLLEIRSTGTNPDTTLNIANAAATTVMNAAREIEWSDDGPQGELLLVDGATHVDETRGSLGRYLELGGGLGFALSVLLVLARGIARGEVLTTGQVGHIAAESLRKKP